MEKWPVLAEFQVKVESLKFQQFYLMKFLPFNFDLKFYWNWSFFHYEKIMRFKNGPQLPGAGRTRAGHHHGSHTPTSPEAVLLHSSLLGYIKFCYTLYMAHGGPFTNVITKKAQVAKNSVKVQNKVKQSNNLPRFKKSQVKFRIRKVLENKSNTDQ